MLLRLSSKHYELEEGLHFDLSDIHLLLLSKQIQKHAYNKFGNHGSSSFSQLLCSTFPSLQSGEHCSGSDFRPPVEQNNDDSDTEIFRVKRRSLKVVKNSMNDNKIKQSTHQVLLVMFSQALI